MRALLRIPVDEAVTTPREEERAGWMVAAQWGDPAAYECLLVSLVPILRAFVRRRGVDPGSVEDVVQEILLSIHRARHTWRPDRPFDPWMWSIARNASTDALRRQTRDRSRRETLPDSGEDALQARIAGDGSPIDPERILTENELTTELTDALRNLSPTQREAVELLYVEQLSVAEAAARAGVTTTALKVRAHRGSRSLRAALRPKEDT
jgi:RNA polymerase sigma-70 factor (ECF subfamily)